MARVWVSWLLSPGSWESRTVRGVANEPTYSRSLMIRNKTAPPQTKQQTTKRDPFPYLFWDHLIFMIIMKTSRSSVCMDSHPTYRLRKISLLSVKHRAPYSVSWLEVEKTHNTLGSSAEQQGVCSGFHHTAAWKCGKRAGNSHLFSLSLWGHCSEKAGHWSLFCLIVLWHYFSN